MNRHRYKIVIRKCLNLRDLRALKYTKWHKNILLDGGVGGGRHGIPVSTSKCYRYYQYIQPWHLLDGIGIWWLLLSVLRGRQHTPPSTHHVSLIHPLCPLLFVYLFCFFMLNPITFSYLYPAGCLSHIWFMRWFFHELKEKPFLWSTVRY